jgi:1-acyl-sn-glycerol-3-phosphate acyltransferase
MIKRIIKSLFGIYAALIFVISLIFTAVGYFLVFTFMSAERAPYIAHQKISRPWSKFLFLLYGLRMKIENQNLLDAGQTYVFIANHQSQLDIPAYAIACNHTFRFLAKAELTKIPLLGYIIRNLYITVDRKDKIARAKSMDRMIRSLKNNISVFICPEGTRNKTHAPLLPFHDGAFRLAIEAGIPLAILVVKNTDKLLSPVKPIELSPGRIDCIWLKPIDTKGLTADDIPSLKEKVADLMTGILKDSGI